MKKIIAIMIAGCLILTLASCQKTPEKDIVVRKNLDNLADLAVQSEKSAPEEGGQPSGSAKLVVPEKLKIELSDEKGNLKIHVDANIVAPDTDVLPTVRVGMRRFTEEDARNLYELLMSDMETISNDSASTSGQMLRIVKQLTEQKEAGKLDKYESMAELDAAIAEAKQGAAKYPDKYERTEPEFSFKPIGGGPDKQTGEGEIMIRATTDDVSVAELIINNAPEDIGTSRTEFYRSFDDFAAYSGVIVGDIYNDFSTHTESPYFAPPEIDEQSAKKVAEDAVKRLGLADFVCTGIRLGALYDAIVDAEDATRNGLYEFMFTRQINGVPINYTDDTGNQFDGDVNAFARPWMYEKIRIFVDDAGISCLVWNSPYEVKEIVAENTAMLNFDEIQSIFEKMIPIVDNGYGSYGEDAPIDVYITEARLGLMRVTERDIGSSGLLVPVWDFMGYFESEGTKVVGASGYASMLTINAIDGSIVDRKLGY